MSTVLLLLHIIRFVASDAQPNVLFILADDLGWNDLGFVNPSNQLITPNINNIASESIILKEYYSHCVCSPTRGEILSGKLAIHTGLTGVISANNPIGLPLNETLLSDTLYFNNYSTHWIGKWHLGYYRWQYMPTFRGFQTSYGYLGGGEDYFYHNSSGVYDFITSNSINCGQNCTFVNTAAFGTYSSYLFTDRTIEILTNFSSSKDNSNPFFIYAPYQSVHAPLQVPQKYIDLYKNTTNITDANRILKAAMVTAMDEGIGNIINALKSLQLYNNTIIIFASDNGAPSGKGGSNYPLRGGKHAIYEGGTRTVGFIRIPDKYFKASEASMFQRNAVNYTYLMHAVDWYPTLIDAANITTRINKNMDGKSHWNNFINIYNMNYNLSNIRNYIYYGNDNAGSTPDFGPYNNTGYRKHHWKLLNTTGGTPNTWFDDDSKETQMDLDNVTSNFTLYNLQKDPNEYENVASKNPDQVNELAQEMLSIQSTSVGPLQRNASCGKAIHPNNSIVGPYSWPWC